MPWQGIPLPRNACAIASTTLYCVPMALMSQKENFLSFVSFSGVLAPIFLGSGFQFGMTANAQLPTQYNWSHFTVFPPILL